LGNYKERVSLSAVILEVAQQLVRSGVINLQSHLPGLRMICFQKLSRSSKLDSWKVIPAYLSFKR